MAERRLGRFRVSERLGQGGMGTVWKAVDDATGKEVALKVVLPEHAADPGFVKRFENEAKALSALAHENVAGCVAHGTDSGRLFLAMELLAGGSLSDKLRHGPMGWRDVAKVGAGIARGLEAIHEKGIVHRDLKPANILLDEQGVPKISDFGLVRDNSQKYEKLTQTGALLGTPEYMAPEQSEGGMIVGPAADLYSLGCTLFCLLTGAPPFPGSGPEVITKHLTVDPPAPSTLAKDCPPALDAIVLRLLSKKPHERGDAELAARELELILTAQAPAPRPRVGLAIGLGAALSLVLGGIAIALKPAPPPPPPPPVVVAPPPPPTKPVPKAPQEPAWYRELPLERRPVLRQGVVCTDVKGEYRNEKDGSILLWVPACEFLMGRGESDTSSDQTDEVPQHPVELSSYFIGKYEVTNEQFDRFLEMTQRGKSIAETSGALTSDVEDTLQPTLNFRTAPPGRGDKNWRKLPVVAVAWSEVMDYVAWAGVRLPTEAEWERAASWDDVKKESRLYAFGGPPGKVVPANNRFLAGLTGDEKVGSQLMPVDSFADFPSPVGALNMTGNAYELCFDIGPYSSTRETDPWTGPNKKLRGGSFGSLGHAVRAIFRRNPNGKPTGDVGFRVALSEDAKRPW
jgi:formylglycine-generating enzyme required for sulfatase activity/predicted Ser/Thr protein kinase